MQQVQFWFIKSDRNQCFQRWPGWLCLDATRNLPVWTVLPLHSQSWPSCVFPPARFWSTTAGPLPFFLKWSDLNVLELGHITFTGSGPVLFFVLVCFVVGFCCCCCFRSHFSAVLSEPIRFRSCCGKTDQVLTESLRPGVISVSKMIPFCFRHTASDPVQVTGSYYPLLIRLHHVYWDSV